MSEKSESVTQRFWSWVTASPSSSPFDAETICQLHAHTFEYTDEYENGAGHVQADKVCTRCDHREVAWTGPQAERLRDLGVEVPTEVLDP